MAFIFIDGKEVFEAAHNGFPFAFFSAKYVIPSPVIPNPDAPEYSVTIGGLGGFTLSQINEKTLNDFIKG